jgi:glyoxylase-like metal-dependent hydrolase (beta-lactamase superfamily II)
MHPRSEHLFRTAEDPEAVLARRLEVARQSGVPEEPLRRWAQRRAASGPLVRFPLEVHRELVPGVVVETDLGAWHVIETPGHAPSHVTLHQPDRRLLLTGDHVLGRVSLYFEIGWSEDPVGEFLVGLDRVDAVDARLALAGHGRPFTDVHGHVEANQVRIASRLDDLRALLRAEGPIAAFDLAPRLYGDRFGEANGVWLFSKVLAYLRHLEVRGDARRLAPEGEQTAERWAAA